MNIPAFPEFIPLDLQAREGMTRYLLQHPPLASEYTFSNLFAWQASHQYAIARYGDGFLIRKGGQGSEAFLQPLVGNNQLHAVQDCLAYLANKATTPMIERVGEDFVASLADDRSLSIMEEREQFDYVYATQEQLQLPGERFHDKKNLLAQFRAKYDARFHSLTPVLAIECIAFAHEWCIERNCERIAGLAQENCAVVRLLTHFAELEVFGGALEVDGHLIAFTLAEALNPDTLVIHAEKAATRYIGVYQAINHEFLTRNAAEYRFINREQDLGVEGLRKAKLSYKPVRMIKKYRILVGL